MTFIPDPGAYAIGDTVYLTRKKRIENYGTFTVGHEFRVSDNNLHYISDSSMPSIRVEDLDTHDISYIDKRDLSRVRP